MRVQPLLLPILALSFGFTLAACSGADDPPRVTTPLECDTGGGQTSECVLTLPSPASFTITLVSRSCDAINNEIKLTSPVTETLTEDACRTDCRYRMGLSDRSILQAPRSASRSCPISSPIPQG